MDFTPRPPRTPDERELERIQKLITTAALAETRRRELVVDLYKQGMSQVEIAARLSRASLAAGGPPIGDDSVFKIIKAARMIPRRQ